MMAGRESNEGGNPITDGSAAEEGLEEWEKLITEPEDCVVLTEEELIHGFASVRNPESPNRRLNDNLPGISRRRISPEVAQGYANAIALASGVR